MADYYSHKEVELQGIKNNEYEKAQTKKAKIMSYVENSSTRRATYPRRARNLLIAVKYIKIAWVYKTIVRIFCSKSFIKIKVIF